MSTVPSPTRPAVALFVGAQATVAATDRPSSPLPSPRGG